MKTVVVFAILGTLLQARCALAHTPIQNGHNRLAALMKRTDQNTDIQAQLAAAANEQSPSVAAQDAQRIAQEQAAQQLQGGGDQAQAAQQSQSNDQAASVLQSQSNEQLQQGSSQFSVSSLFGCFEKCMNEESLEQQLVSAALSGHITIENDGGNNLQNNVAQQATVTVTKTVTAGASATSAQQNNAVDNAVPTFSPNGLTNISTSGGQILVAGPNQMVVAPKKGDLRFVPFSIDAAVGSNVTFAWGAGPHTVTQSSALEVCNKTQSQGAFDSGKQNAGFQFPIQVMDTKPIWVYCSVQPHCVKGMFGLINPPKTNNTQNMLSTMLSSTNDAGIANLMNQTQTMTANSPASAWGATFDMSKFPQDFHNETLTNVLLTRQLFAANPQLLTMNEQGDVVNNAAGVTQPGASATSAATSSTRTAFISAARPVSGNIPWTSIGVLLAGLFISAFSV